MEQPRDTSKEALSRACMRLGTALPKDATAQRERLAALHTKVEAVLSTDTAALAALAEEVAQCASEIEHPHARAHRRAD